MLTQDLAAGHLPKRIVLLRPPMSSPFSAKITRSHSANRAMNAGFGRTTGRRQRTKAKARSRGQFP